MLPTGKVKVVQYEEEDGKSPFKSWFDSLDHIAGLKVQGAIFKMQKGNFSNAKFLGGGVGEYKVNFGPGYRIYFGRDGERLIILLGGGTKKRQTRDVKVAKELWKEYKAGKGKEVKTQWH
ncbi:MAG: type II toxin-antitoxin system RelE/ParE family toxin [Candidatus Dadabacteria bacterium]|nr:type II toxin-antitoxin system RelE/ParE family toxin [Candidatus Dadabacteria bacterium]